MLWKTTLPREIKVPETHLKTFTYKYIEQVSEAERSIKQRTFEHLDLAASCTPVVLQKFRRGELSTLPPKFLSSYRHYLWSLNTSALRIFRT
jgi:hypothetical protein